MKIKLLILIITIQALVSGTLKAQWQIHQKDTSLYGEYYSSVSFITDSIGFLVGCTEFSAWNSIGLFKTKDGGNSWNPIGGTSGGGCRIPNSFLNDSVGYDLISFGTLQANQLRKTTNGGLSWYQADTTGNLYLGTNFSNDDIYFTDPLLGFISRDTSIFRTVNGGKSWQMINIGHIVNCFFFTSAQTGYAGGNKIILKTSNGGQSWNVVDTSYSIISLYFPSSNTGYAVGPQGTVLKSSNGGNTWIPQLTSLPASISLNSIFCPDNNNCYAVGEQGIILNTTDGGNSWVKQNSGLKAKLNSVSCTGTKCFAVGDTSVLLKTVGGITGTGSNNIGRSEINIFPNPFSTEAIVKMNLPSKNPVTIFLYDMLGEEVKKICNDPIQEIIVRRDNLHNGIYFVHIIQDKKNIFITKLILED